MQKNEIDLSIIIPVFNEEENVLVLYEEIKEVVNYIAKRCEIIFVNDGSTDKTFEVLKGIKKKQERRSPNLKIISFSRNFGQTAAMQAGFDYSLGRIIVSMDGDLQNDPRDIPRFLMFQRIKHPMPYSIYLGVQHQSKKHFLETNMLLLFSLL